MNSWTKIQILETQVQGDGTITGTMRFVFNPANYTNAKLRSNAWLEQHIGEIFEGAQFEERQRTAPPPPMPPVPMDFKPQQE